MELGLPTGRDLAARDAVVHHNDTRMVLTQVAAGSWAAHTMVVAHGVGQNSVAATERFVLPVIDREEAMSVHGGLLLRKNEQLVFSCIQLVNKGFDLGSAIGQTAFD